MRRRNVDYDIYLYTVHIQYSILFSGNFQLEILSNERDITFKLLIHGVSVRVHHLPNPVHQPIQHHPIHNYQSMNKILIEYYCCFFIFTLQKQLCTRTTPYLHSIHTRTSLFRTLHTPVNDHSFIILSPINSTSLYLPTHDQIPLI